MRTDNIYFDLESGPLAEEKLAIIRPSFDPASVRGADEIGKPFDPTAVKLGRTKDPDKIEAIIEQARERGLRDQRELVQRVEEAEKKYFTDFAERAALDACRGQVLAVGYLSDRGSRRIDDRDEKSMLVQFWDVFRSASGDGRKMVGFNLFHFDLPFLVRRTWLLGLHVPIDVIDRNRFWHPCFIDLAEVYRLGVHGEYKKLKEIAVSMGVTDELGDDDGADFARLLEEDRPKAIEHLHLDLIRTKGIAERILPNVE